MRAGRPCCRRGASVVTSGVPGAWPELTALASAQVGPNIPPNIRQRLPLAVSFSWTHGALLAMADISALSQLLDASLDPRRNKEGKSLFLSFL
jgi:hypothetical protein